MKKRLTETEKASLIKTVNKFRSEGRTLKESCGEAGITVSNFNYWMDCDKNGNGSSARLVNEKRNNNHKTTNFSAITLADSDITRLETMITERETLISQLNTLNTTIKTTFEKVRELEKTIAY